MNIIAAAGRERFIVEMSQDEIVKAAGFSSAYDTGWEKANSGRDVKVGTVINVGAAYDFHSRIACNELGFSLSNAALTNLRKLHDRSQRDAFRGSGDER